MACSSFSTSNYTAVILLSRKMLVKPYYYRNTFYVNSIDVLNFFVTYLQVLLCTFSFIIKRLRGGPVEDETVRRLYLLHLFSFSLLFRCGLQYHNIIFVPKKIKSIHQDVHENSSNIPKLLWISSSISLQLQKVSYKSSYGEITVPVSS